MNDKKNFKIISGIRFPAELSDYQCHLSLFLNAPKMQKYPDDIWDLNGQQAFYTGAGRFEHARIIGKILFLKAFEWHLWSDAIVGKACNSNWLAICGCGASSKS